MDEIDRDAAAKLHERDDSGSDLHYHFKLIAKGTVAVLVRQVAAMSSDERARVVIDVEGGRSFNVGEILTLAQREDLP